MVTGALSSLAAFGVDMLSTGFRNEKKKTTRWWHHNNSPSSDTIFDAKYVVNAHSSTEKIALPQPCKVI